MNILKAGGSDSPTPYTVDGQGITLPAGETFPAHGQVNIKFTSADSPETKTGIHFDPNNDHPGGAWIGESFIPWSAFGLEPGDCVTWVQIHGYNQHFGEGGQDEICVVEPPEDEEPEDETPPEDDEPEDEDEEEEPEDEEEEPEDEEPQDEPEEPQDGPESDEEGDPIETPTDKPDAPESGADEPEEGENDVVIPELDDIEAPQALEAVVVQPKAPEYIETAALGETGSNALAGLIVGGALLVTGIALFVKSRTLGR